MATTPYPFVASTVLTASQLNSTFNIPVSTKTANYVLTAADAGTRVVMNAAGATTITVNTSIFSAGDNLQISNIGAGVTTLTAGTATVSSAGPLAIPQYGGGTLYFTSASAAIFFASAGPAASSGLVCVQAQTAFTAVSSVTVDNIFTSTYTNYKIVVEYQTSTTNDIVMQLRVSGTASATSYYAQRFVSQSAGQFPLAEDNTSSFAIMNNTAGAFLGFADITLMSPQLAQPTLLQSHIMAPNTNYSTLYSGYRMGVHNVATAYDGFIFSVGSGNITGKYTIYGYAKTV